MSINKVLILNLGVVYTMDLEAVPCGMAFSMVKFMKMQNLKSLDP